MARLNKSTPAELKPRNRKPTLLCSGYLCPKAERCKRFKDTHAFHRRMILYSSSDPGNVIFQSSTVNANGKCVYFIEDLSDFGCNR